MNLIKKISLFFLMSVVSSMCLSKTNNEDPIIVIFDYHDVIVKKNTKKIATEAGSLFWNNIGDTFTFLKVGLNVIQKKFNGIKLSVGNIVKDIPALEKYREDLYRLGTLEDPIEETVNLIKRLRQQRNVILVLASNMNEDSFEYNKKSKPELFNLFDVRYISGDNNGEKPDKKFYEGMCEKIKRKCPEAEYAKKIFIDDKKSNVVGAENADLGIQGILFKNAEQLEQELAEVGVIKQ